MSLWPERHSCARRKWAGAGGCCFTPRRRSVTRFKWLLEESKLLEVALREMKDYVSIQQVFSRVTSALLNLSLSQLRKRNGKEKGREEEREKERKKSMEKGK